MGGMIALICFVLAMLASPFKSKSRLEAENAALRHQLTVLRRKVRIQFTTGTAGLHFCRCGVIISRRADRVSSEPTKRSSGNLRFWTICRRICSAFPPVDHIPARY